MNLVLILQKSCKSWEVNISECESKER